MGTKDVMVRKKHQTRLLVLGKEFLAPAIITLIALLLIDVALRSEIIIKSVDMYRPQYLESTLRVHVEKQMWHIEALALATNPRLAIVGSSSVVNGINPDIIQQGRDDKKLDVENLGMTGLLAYELPLLSKYILTKKTMEVVYLYNTFSFANCFHPDAVDVRWNTIEALCLSPWKNLQYRDFLQYIDRFPAEQLWVIRYRNLLRTMFMRWIKNETKPLAYPWDYPPNSPPPPEHRLRQYAKPVPDTNWIRKAYRDSTDLDDTLGYRGLRRFCEQAKAAGVRLIIAPVVEPDFALFGAYAEGTDRARVDDRVEKIAKDCGATFIPRRDFRDIEQQDGLFQDDVHLHSKGRRIYSERLGSILRCYQ